MTKATATKETQTLMEGTQALKTYLSRKGLTFDERTGTQHGVWFEIPRKKQNLICRATIVTEKSTQVALSLWVTIPLYLPQQMHANLAEELATLNFQTPIGSFERVPKSSFQQGKDQMTVIMYRTAVVLDGEGRTTPDAISNAFNSTFQAIDRFNFHFSGLCSFVTEDTVGSA